MRVLVLHVLVQPPRHFFFRPEERSDHPPVSLSGICSKGKGEQYTRPAHPKEFRDQLWALALRDVLQDVDAGDDVECPVGEGK
jgi:hypothetical protein